MSPSSSSFLRLQVVCPWNNPRDRFDANFDRFASPQDALVIINELNDPRVIANLGRLPVPESPRIASANSIGGGFARLSSPQSKIGSRLQVPNAPLATPESIDHVIAELCTALDDKWDFDDDLDRVFENWE